MLGDAVPEEEVEAACEELSPEYRELSQRVLTDPGYYGSFECRPDSLDPYDSLVPEKG
jgi:hypothetical protein